MRDMRDHTRSEQSREPRHRIAARNRAETDLELAEHGALKAGEPHVAGKHDLAPGPV